MKRLLIAGGTVTGLLLAPVSLAHPGLVDANRCHSCGINCGHYGLQYGQFHCHDIPVSSERETLERKRLRRSPLNLGPPLRQNTRVRTSRGNYGTPTPSFIPKQLVRPRSVRDRRDLSTIYTTLRDQRDANYTVLVKQRNDMGNVYDELLHVTNKLDLTTAYTLRELLDVYKDFLDTIEDFVDEALHRNLTTHEWAQIYNIQRYSVQLLDFFIDVQEFAEPLNRDGVPAHLQPETVRRNVFVPAARRTKSYQENFPQMCQRLLSRTPISRGRTSANFATQMYVKGCISEAVYCDSFRITGEARPTVCR